MCLETGLNCRHKDFQSFALPTELSKLTQVLFNKISPRISSKFKDVFVVVLDKFVCFKDFTFDLKKCNDLNLSQLILDNKTKLNGLSFNQNTVSSLTSENSVILTIFQIAKNLVI